MKKLFLILLLIFSSSFALSAECYRQKNPIGFTDYDICEVTGTGYICISLEDNAGAISCFPSPRYYEAAVPSKREVIRRVIRNEASEDEDDVDSGKGF